MVTVYNLTTEYVGLSTDDKPTECRNGDRFIEMDTGYTYLYSEEEGEWLKQSSAS